MAHPAIKRLHQDIQHWHQAQDVRGKAAHELGHDKAALKADRRHGDHLHDAFDHAKKELKGDRKAVSKLSEQEHKALKPIADKRAEVQAAYDKTIDPLTGQGDPLLEGQLAQLDAKATQVKDGFDGRIAAKRDEMGKLTGTMDRAHQGILDTRKEIKGDVREVKHDQKALAHAKGRVHDTRHRALEHLEPAEYHLGLEQTNEVRHELGLHSVHHVIRPGLVSGDAAAKMKRLAHASADVARSMGGYSSQSLCATGVSRALAKLGISVGGNGNEIDNNLPRSKFKQVHISLAKALKTPGCILTWEHTSTAAGSKYGHTAITWGDGHTSSSDFIERDTLAGAHGRTGLKIFVMR